MHKASVVIMAGGRGERFWPYSRTDYPKQFLQVVGEGTLLQQAVRRALRLVPWEELYIVTSEELVDAVRQQVPEINPKNIILEPVGRDTAPCIGLAALYLAHKDSEQVMIVLPADHFIPDEDRFADTLHVAKELAGSTDFLITVGIRPTRPETGYGYIRLGEPYPGEWGKPVFWAKEFTEKPNLERALLFLSTNQYLWNSGMFIWKVKVILKAIERYLPELFQGLKRIEAHLGSEREAEILAQEFPGLPRISIDYGVMEKADRVLVIPGDFAWDDLGTWTALERVCELDGQGNLLQAQAVLMDTEGSVIRAQKEDKLVVAFGVKNTLIIDTEDVLLVADKSRAPQLKEVILELKRRGLEQYLTSKTASSGEGGRPQAFGLAFLRGGAFPHCHIQEKPWGREVWWSVTEKYVGKVIYVRGGHSLSRQYHRLKQETMMFLSGEGILELGEEKMSIYPGLIVDILPGTIHRVSAITDITFLEVSTPELDDVVRLQDEYGRVG
ncbi:mannose-1-phosphate guanylyltransferase [Thermanaeromonas toyohensis ToBE]|uniref:mannose-1-phosphate guanylyltransferase n=1 Tax=Thermanaeromonas toyohensis ToBE TaxID=698762 RepID=A0A1W1VYN3_9FIRM|nr:mannose-1-phosphate guanylyltransferase [Thermanaeromonas toyohensis]SMB98221.1 mannose-1-phosphate guanylyltransferase [Thermanaeromonas toyohensis ToBE]